MDEQRNAKRFLIVDDDSIFHFLITKMLSRIGITPDSVDTSLSGKEALDRIVEWQLGGKPVPDFIFLDLNMPIMGGFAFLEACNKLPEKLPPSTQIAIISSSLDKRDHDRALGLGAQFYIVKPVTEGDLNRILNK